MWRTAGSSKCRQPCSEALLWEQRESSNCSGAEIWCKGQMVFKNTFIFILYQKSSYKVKEKYSMKSVGCRIQCIYYIRNLLFLLAWLFYLSQNLLFSLLVGLFAFRPPTPSEFSSECSLSNAVFSNYSEISMSGSSHLCSYEFQTIQLSAFTQIPVSMSISFTVYQNF